MHLDEPPGAGAQDVPQALDAPARGRRLLFLLAAVALGSALLLALHAAFFEPHELHVSGNFVDQAGYITTARHLADHGELRNGIVYPAYLDRPRWRPYMPGHYLALALSYGALGWGVLPTLLPSLLGFVLAACAAFAAGNELYGARAGLVASALFALFPVAIPYAFTAMAELSFTAASAAAFAALVLLPARLRPFVLAPLLCLPFLFRETALLIALPMGAVLVSRGAPLRSARLQVALAVAAGALLCYGLHRWQVHDGKGTVSLAWGAGGMFNYAGTPQEGELSLSAGDWIRSLAGNLRDNTRESLRALASPGELRGFGLFAFLALAGACLGAGFRRSRADPLPLAAGAAALAMLLAVHVLYDVKAQKLVRGTLFLVPVLSVGTAGAWRAARTRPPRWMAVPLAGALAASLVLARRSGSELTALDPYVEEARTFVEELPHDDRTLLMADFRLAPVLLDYAVQHYPVRWAFMPADPLALTKLAMSYPIGTFFFYEPPRRRDETPPELALGGEVAFRTRMRLGSPDYLTGRKEYLVYCRP